MTSPAPRGLFTDQVDAELERMGKTEAIRWIRFTPSQTPQSGKVLRQLASFAGTIDQLVYVFDGLLDSNQVTYVFRDPCAAVISAMFSIAETRGDICWRITTGESPR